ncbi:FecCD family ABC transporter permease [Bacillus testis]|uniref:FecCD family ABC transporter permease n=1 Tax=Bacillus testis TaxID=1622072 RepID=UPI00067F6A0E|nr:iron ABC transporter permease [Bacillus testis]
MEQHKNRKRGLALITSGLILVFLLIPFGVIVGSAHIELGTVWQAIAHYNHEMTEHIIVRDVRLPREISAALVGSALAAAGAIMQGMTRNPLADSGLLGLNAGASFLLAISFAFFPALGFMGHLAFSFVGAGLGALLVFMSVWLVKGAMSPFRIVLAGAAVSALLSALAQGVALYFNVSKDLTFWTSGGVATLTWNDIQILLPVIIVSLAGAVAISGKVTVLSFGEDVATGLGQNIVLVKAIATIVVLLLAGSAVATVGSIAFVGLVVPHIVRYIVGVDYRWIIPGSAVAGAALMLLADIGARTLNPPFETPIGAIISFISVPFFIYLVTRRRKLI